MRSDSHPPEPRRSRSSRVFGVFRGSTGFSRFGGSESPTAAIRLLCAFALLSWASCAQAASAPDAFEQANQLYERGQFAEAAAAYEALVRANTTSPALFFNLGNACFKAGRLGRALVNYRRAEELAPRDPDIRANLQFARNSVPGANLRPANRWVRWLPRLTLNEAALVAAVTLWVWAGLLTLRQLRPATRKPLRVLTLLAGVLTLFLVAFAAANWHLRRATLTAIVVVPEATVHYGPLDESPSAFSVRDGLELEVADTKGDWVQVTDATRRVGWIKRDQAVLFPVAANLAHSR